MKEPWIVFFGADGKELMAYTVRGSFKGELESTLDMLAQEHGCNVGDITFAEITR